MVRAPRAYRLGVGVRDHDHARAGGTGNAVRVSGYEEWTLAPDGLIADSQGRYDQAEYDRQLEHGVEGAA